MKQGNRSQFKKGTNGVLQYFMCGMAVAALCAATTSFIMPDESRISAYASPEPLRAMVPSSGNTRLDMELSWSAAAGVTACRDTTSYVEGTGSTCFIVDNGFRAGPVAAGQMNATGNSDTGELSFWIKVSVQHGDASCIRLETENGTTIPLTSELPDTSWHRASWEPEYGQTGPVILKVDSDEFRGSIWLDGIGTKSADDVDLFYHNLASPPPGWLREHVPAGNSEADGI